MSRRLKYQLKLLPLITLLQGLLRPLDFWQLPPKFLRRLVGGRVSDQDFLEGARQWTKYVIQDTHLKPSGKVLDIGCGCGITALGLQSYFNQHGSYEGFDIYPELIYWCRQQIEMPDSRFHFRLANLYHPQYHPEGRLKTRDYQFMYPDNYFDAVSAWSVFTHLPAKDVKHYLSEAVRVLKPHGYLWISYFLMQPKAVSAIKAGTSQFTFGHKLTTDSWSETVTLPEIAICYQETALDKWYAQAGLKITRKRYGGWIQSSQVINFQDVIVAQKIS